MNINDAFSSNYIKASDLQGRDVPVVIRGVEIEPVGRDKDQKPVIYFRGKEKGMVLNKTNANAISKLYGADTNGWLGKSIIIYPTETEFGGETVECIRIRLKAGPGAAAPAPQPVAMHDELDPDQIPF